MNEAVGTEEKSLEWRNDPPTEGGWYWSGPAAEVAYICRVWENDGVLGVGGPDDIHPFEPIDEYHEEGWKWAGPIPKPSEA